ncbi:nucleoid-associated protein [Moraxella sp. FZFQ2102]|uniref:nucleoid-associated protein n=1 Tax=Moraxella sp. FZFQ2102 TaxID=2953752 RepID=UPI00209BC690|nr:nucleoid-associated protein [Moraxella sp. FZFQ2102]USZ15726.1 nucleoid-associated protein [Moraxella sp. FZFQ2102]
MNTLLDLGAAKVKKVIVHHVGNKFRDEGVMLSDAESEHDATLDDLLLKFFLAPVVNSENEYLLNHESDINLNLIKHYSSLVFKDENEFVAASVAVAKHLYISSTHPNIGGGEFIEILYDGIRINDLEIQAIGLFKIEAKNSYLDIKNNHHAINIVEKKGISVDSIQKGAVVLSVDNTVFIVDNLGKKTKYWLDSFIKAIPKNTTKKYVQILGSVTKAIANKISLPQEHLNFSEALANEDILSINKLREISSPFIEKNNFDSIVDGIGVKSGLVVDADFSVEAQKLSKQVKQVISKTSISKGVNIVVTEPDLKISSIDVQDTEFGLRAIIDIKKEGV